MPTQEDFEATPASVLAMLCRRISEVTSIDSPTRDKARELLNQWTRLQTPLNPNPQQQQRIEQQKKDQKARIVDFLVHVA